MKWSSLQKEQKQKIVLGIMMAVLASAAIFQFGLNPMFERRAKNSDEREQLQQKILTAGGMIAKARTLKEQLGKSDDFLKDVYARHIPPPENASTWILNFIQERGRRAGVTIAEVIPPDRSSAPVAPGAPKKNFEHCMARVQVLASYEDIVEFVRILETDDPYLSIVEMNIDRDASTPERHKATIQIDWPLAQPEAPAPKAAGGKDAGRA